MSDAKSYMRTYLRQGLEKLAFSKEDAENIAEYFYQVMDDDLVKQASLPQTFGGIAMKAVGETAAKAGTALAMGLGAYGAHGIYDGLVKRPMQASRFAAAVEQAIERNQILQHADRAKVDNMAATIMKYAPNAAADPNLLSSILSNAVMMDGIDPTVVQGLVNLERAYNDSHKTSLSDLVLKG